MKKILYLFLLNFLYFGFSYLYSQKFITEVKFIKGEGKEEFEKKECRNIIIPKVSFPVIIDSKIEKDTYKIGAKTENFVLTKEKTREIVGAYFPSISTKEDFINVLKGLGYKISKEGYAISKAQTDVYIFYDEENIYFIFRCEEPYIEKMKKEITQHDGKVWTDDDIEIFIDTNNDRKDYYQFLLNSIGTKAELYVKKENSQIIPDFNYNPIWEARTYIEKGYWIAEICIPFKSLGLKKAPSEGTVWGLNLGRERYADKELSTWSAVERGFQEPESFGELIFSKLPPFSIENISFGDYGLGENRAKIFLKNHENKDKKLKLKLITNFSNKEIFHSLLFISLKGKEIKKIEMPYILKQKGEYNLTLSIEDINSKDKKEYYYSLNFDKPILYFTLDKEDVYFSDKTNTIDFILNIGEISLKDIFLDVILKKNDKIIKREKIGKIIGKRGFLSFNISDIDEGKYLICLTIKDKKGKIICSDIKTFKKIKGPFDQTNIKKGKYMVRKETIDNILNVFIKELKREGGIDIEKSLFQKPGRGVGKLPDFRYMSTLVNILYKYGEIYKKPDICLLSDSQVHFISNFVKKDDPTWLLGTALECIGFYFRYHGFIDEKLKEKIEKVMEE
ncbi:MAG: sugar-binding protein [Candidatus Ratteibacteria bacterium]